jgi:hypothetical protein
MIKHFVPSWLGSCGAVDNARSSMITELFAWPSCVVWADQKGTVARESIAASVTTLGCFECGTNVITSLAATCNGNMHNSVPGIRDLKKSRQR